MAQQVLSRPDMAMIWWRVSLAPEKDREMLIAEGALEPLARGYSNVQGMSSSFAGGL